MRIIISPAKQMRVDTDTFTCSTLPVFMEKTEILMQWIQRLSYEEQKKLWACSDKIARQNAERFENMDLRQNLTPALLSYDGIQYTYMAPAVFEDGQYNYVQNHLRILSGFYGVVKPMDGVVPYRLEMQAKAAVSGFKNLYDFWGDRLYREVADDSRIIVNLASKEYSRCIEKYLQPDDRYITCTFGELEGDKIVQKGVYAKMARRLKPLTGVDIITIRNALPTMNMFSSAPKYREKERNEQAQDDGRTSAADEQEI